MTIRIWQRQSFPQSIDVIRGEVLIYVGELQLVEGG